MFIGGELSNVLMIELRAEEAKHSDFLVDMRVAIKQHLSLGVCERNFSLTSKITFVRALSVRERSVFAAKAENND